MTRLHPTRFSIVLGTALLLTACSDEPEVSADDDGRSASGEVLEGTISDDMLALDAVRSQPPLLEAVEGAAGEGGATTPADEEPAEEPAPEDAPVSEEPQTFDEAFSEEG